MSERRRFIWVIILIIAAILIGIVAYFFSHQSSLPSATIKELGSGFCSVSPDFQHIACLQTQATGARWVIDGNPGNGYENVDRDFLLQPFSPDGRVVAYGAEENGKWFMVVNGQAQTSTYDMVSDPIFSQSGHNFAYVATEGTKQLLVVNDIEGPMYDEIIIKNPVFSPDGEHVAYIAKNGGNYYLILDGRQSQPYSYGPVSLAFSPDSKQFAYIARNQTQEFLILNGAEIASANMRTGDDLPNLGFPPIMYPTFSPDSSQFAYVVASGSQYAVVDNGTPSPFYDEVGPLNFTTGNILYYVAQSQGFSFPVQNGIIGTKYSLSSTAGLGDFAISNDGENVAYAVSKNSIIPISIDQQYYDVTIMENGHSIATYYAAPGITNFSFMGNHLVYILGDAGSEYLVVDGEKGPEYNDISQAYYDVDNNSVDYLGEKIPSSAAFDYYLIQQPL